MILIKKESSAHKWHRNYLTFAIIIIFNRVKMKKLLSAISILLLIINVAFGQIPNFSFENWTNMGSYENPDLWATMNNTTSPLGVYTATKGTPGNVGSYYLKLTSKTTSSGVRNAIAVSGKLDTITMLPKSGFAFNQRPQSFTGNWQHMIYGTSAGAISVALTKWNSVSIKRDTVALAGQKLSGMVMSWAAFTFNFTYQSGEFPDSCIIFLQASGSVPTNLDYLYLDNLAFTGSVAGVENNTIYINIITLFPNPTNDNIMIELNLKSSENTVVEIRDLNGKIVLTKDLGTLKGLSKQSIGISSLAAGSYLVNIISGKETKIEKIIKR